MEVPSVLPRRDRRGVRDVVVRRRAGMTSKRGYVISCNCISCRGWNWFGMRGKMVLHSSKMVIVSEICAPRLVSCPYSDGIVGPWFISVVFFFPVSVAFAHPPITVPRIVIPPQNCDGPHHYYVIIVCGIIIMFRA